MVDSARSLSASPSVMPSRASETSLARLRRSALKSEAERTDAEQLAVTAYEESRSRAEVLSFGRALGDMELWYAHQGTTVYMLTKLPEGSTREVGYSDSGWTTYERCSAEQIKKFFQSNLSLKVLTGKHG